MKSSTLLPCIEGIRIESIASNANSIVLHLSAMAPAAYCPLCGHVSQRIHSHYQRTLADLPWNRPYTKVSSGTYSSPEKERVSLYRVDMVIETRHPLGRGRLPKKKTRLKETRKHSVSL